MIIDLNGLLYIDSNLRNWFIRSGTPRQRRGKISDDSEGASEDIKGRYRELAAAIRHLEEGRRYGQFRADDLADARAICEAIDDARAEIERVFATPLRLQQLRPLRIAFVVLRTADQPGYRFQLNDRYSVQRQEWRADKQRWESANFYDNLGYALGETLLAAAREAEVGGRGACLAKVAELRAEMLAVAPKLPEAYWGAAGIPQTPSETPFKKLIQGGGALAGVGAG